MNHEYAVNASLQLLPVDTGRHPYEWVDGAIGLIRDSGLRYEVGPFGTSVEGRYGEVRDLIDRLHQHLLDAGCPEWLLQVQWQVRAAGDVTAEEKVGPHRTG